MPRTRKRLPLVCEHLENISRDALENHQNVIRAYVRRRQGVYALYRKSKLYYVGLAKDLRGRLTAHVRDRHGESWDRFSVYFTIGDQHLKEMESFILRIVKLKGNKVKGKFAKSRDLRRQFARDIRSEYRKEFALLLGREWIDPQVSRNDDESSVRPPALAAYSPLRSGCAPLTRARLLGHKYVAMGGFGSVARFTSRPQPRVQRSSEEAAMGGPSGNMSAHRATGYR
jgi:hypothetical protein